MVFARKFLSLINKEIANYMKVVYEKELRGG